MSDTDGDGLSDEYEMGIGTDPNNPDSDGDTLPDGSETNSGIYINNENTGTDPLNSDSDYDGLKDNEEILCLLFGFAGKFCSLPLDSDTDNDGLSDGEEYNGFLINGELIKTNPIDNDTDKDGLTDGLELGIYGDIFENEYNSNSCLTRGGVSTYSNCEESWQPDEDELSTTNPIESDSDGDGIEDGNEDINKNGKLDIGETAADLFDTDGGGRSDFEELFVDSTDPRNS